MIKRKLQKSLSNEDRTLQTRDVHLQSPLLEVFKLTVKVQKLSLRDKIEQLLDKI